MDGGYDDGYRVCSCFWGRNPGSLLSLLHDHCHDFRELRVLDAGCGEGKNAAYLAQHGAYVRAIDISEVAISNARAAWPDCPNVEWEVADLRALRLPHNAYDIIIAYGLMHCFGSEEDIRMVVGQLQQATCSNGIHILCAFNNRHQELVAHPGFSPTLASHVFYVKLYEHWQLLHATDEDLREAHPHNKVEHVHSLTRLIARKAQP